jgi:hypothetical protein
MAMANAIEPPASSRFVALLEATKSNGLPPPLPGCKFGGRVGFGFVFLVDEDGWSSFEG